MRQGIKFLKTGPFKVTYVRSETVPTCSELCLSSAMSFIVENSHSHFADVPGYVTAAANSCFGSFSGFLPSLYFRICSTVDLLFNFRRLVNLMTLYSPQMRWLSSCGQLVGSTHSILNLKCTDVFIVDQQVLQIIILSDFEWT
jgi:hypothetical protein